MKTIVTVFALFASAATASEQAGKIAILDKAENGANPIRKVVTMLQMMIKKIEAQGKKEQEVFDKYMCYCETSDLTLTKDIEEANTKIPQLESDIKEGTEHKAQLETDLGLHMGDRDAAKTAMAKATAIREKEHAAFLAEEATDKANIDALGKAITAIGDGMAGGFLQTSDAQLLRKLSVGTQLDMLDLDRQMLVSFLSGTEADGYIPKSGEILGILKQLKDEMDKDLAEMTATENAAAQTYEELMAAKKKELESLNAAIEQKLKRVGELGVELAMKKNDLEDTKEALGEDTLFLADLVKNCGTKKKEWEAICKTRSEELIALQETIKILNDDDALELFKKTLPSASFLQIQGSTKSVRMQALKIIQAAMKSSKSSPRMDFIELALRGKKQGFEKVIKLIDDMVVTLGKEQADDDHKKEYCEVQFDLADDKKKGLERAISDSEKVIAETNDSLAAVTEEIAALEASIIELDKAVVKATEQRKEEHADYEAEMAANSAAKEIIGFAKNRMQKFYNPKLYKPPPKRELTEEERITLNMGGTLAPTNPPGGIAGTGVSFVQVNVHQAKKDAPPPPPEAVGAYKKKSEESGGVLAMMDLLVAELDKEMTEAEVEEKDAQGDYEKLMMDSSALRAGDSKLVTEKTAAKAEFETQLQAAKETKQADATELKATLDYISTLHTECDFLLEYYQVRKEARASEIDALKKAKAVLSGADFSLMQTNMRLRGATRSGDFKGNKGSQELFAPVVDAAESAFQSAFQMIEVRAPTQATDGKSPAVAGSQQPVGVQVDEKVMEDLHKDLSPACSKRYASMMSGEGPSMHEFNQHGEGSKSNQCEEELMGSKCHTLAKISEAKDVPDGRKLTAHTTVEGVSCLPKECTSQSDLTTLARFMHRQTKEIFPDEAIKVGLHVDCSSSGGATVDADGSPAAPAAPAAKSGASSLFCIGSASLFLLFTLA